MYTCFRTYHKTYHIVYFKYVQVTVLCLNKADKKHVRIKCSQGQTESHKSLDQDQADTSASLLLWGFCFKLRRHMITTIHLPSGRKNTWLLTDLFQTLCWVLWEHIYFVVRDTIFGHCAEWYASRKVFPSTLETQSPTDWGKIKSSTWGL